MRDKIPYILLAIFLVSFGLYLWADQFPHATYRIVSVSGEPTFQYDDRFFKGYEVQTEVESIPDNPFGVNFIQRWGILIMLVPGFFTLGLVILLGQTIWRKVKTIILPEQQ